MSLAERFWDLLGSWSGVEELPGSRPGPVITARAALTFKLDLAGTAVVQDYRQVRADGAERLAHGVFVDADVASDGVLWWLFESDGPAPQPGCGGWADGVLELTRTTAWGSARHRFALEPDRLTYAVDDTVPGQAPVPRLRGRYVRVSGH